MQVKEYTDNLLRNGKATQAIKELTAMLENGVSPAGQVSDLNTAGSDEIHYLIGNSYYKIGDWQKAIQHYTEACVYNADSPAKEKLKMTYSILEFYNKDIYGQ